MWIVYLLVIIKIIKDTRYMYYNTDGVVAWRVFIGTM